MTQQLYVDVHVLQTVPPSNLNRDDSGSPKQAVYGGVRRSRVSSQAWKRATRRAFAERVPVGEGATRTKRLTGLVAADLAGRGDVDTKAAIRVAAALLSTIEITVDKKKPEETSYLLFFGLPQVRRLADLVAGDVASLAGLPDKELAASVGLHKAAVRECLRTGHPLDVALFGRMVADLAALNVDAATQVAHALSTHAVHTEFDYFTAVDDEKDKQVGEESTGAGMIGTVEFNSATLYRYATVGVHQLRENLGGDVTATGNGLELFLESFVQSMPSGHQNTFGHRTAPDLVLFVVREDQPVNLVSAFETPVHPAAGGGHVEQSVNALVHEFVESTRLWGLEPRRVVAVYRGAERPELGPAVPLADAVRDVAAFVEQAWTSV